MLHQPFKIGDYIFNMFLCIRDAKPQDSTHKTLRQWYSETAQPEQRSIGDVQTQAAEEQ